MTRILIVEDDFSSRRMMQKTLEEYGAVDAVVDGEEAVQAYSLAVSEQKPYDIIFMDIMMPRMDGQEALRQIRKLEQEAGVDPVREVRVVMTTVLEDPHNVVSAYFKGGATAYIVKPVDRLKIKAEMTKFGLLPGTKS
ncbi:MAG: two-component system response regulator [Spirochaetes bacterium GWD1_61_31]|nr:MAG: two-component system response regulator [Spirochaetes bacterium GWB1_60_80]OHD30570.1 MAG: two-component system response regulator [Spirochaetes bacterium GWC1_61_12]OHD34838.1 MAG: two-component system response regulator [Spirochaetes bacterium GWD1_61_31]OHD46684.1 MAG: two-component system response regulator [Spirochaetes bacterium GWE1_60_18]OHD60313.1 MAG: two-component system response regulator [Spirochaetes bacterium GWF1_60_12]HAP44211.1 response regulator [Spirochaetaceae bact